MSERSKKTTEETDAKNRSIEECFEYLDEVIRKMEDPDLPLEESFDLYEKGMK